MMTNMQCFIYNCISYLFYCIFIGIGYGPYVTGVDIYITEDYLNGTFKSCSQVLIRIQYVRNILLEFLHFKINQFAMKSIGYCSVNWSISIRFDVW